VVMRRRSPMPPQAEVPRVPFLRSAHGAARDGGRTVVVESPPPDELGAGVVAPPRPPVLRDAQGRLLPCPGLSELGRAGARALHESRQLSRLLGLWQPPESDAYHPYHRMAREWRDEHTATLAATVGGGTVGPGPASIVASAALQLAASRYLFDLGAQKGDARILASAARLADQSRQSLLSAHALCALEAKAKAASNPVSFPWMRGWAGGSEGAAGGVGPATNPNLENNPGDA
jgi:hypothetical protein